MTVDLNHGSGPLVAPMYMPPGGYGVGREINKLVDAALVRLNNARPVRDYIGGSELGDPCQRRVYYGAKKIPKEPFTGDKLRIFYMGHVFESMVADWLKEAGFDLKTVDDQGNQFEVVTANGMVKNHCDGIFVGGPTIEGLTYPCLWENKALKNRGWQNIVKRGLARAEPKYFAQIQIYLGYFNIPFCLFTAINKDTAEIYHALVPYQLEQAQRASDAGVDMIRALARDEPPPGIASQPDFFMCRMCQYVKYCYESRAND